MKCCSAINSTSLFGKDLELYFSFPIVSIAVMKRYVEDKCWKCDSLSLNTDIPGQGIEIKCTN